MRSRESFNLEERRDDDRNRVDGTDDDESQEKRNSHGFYVSPMVLCATIAIFIFIITFAVLLTYNFGICSNINVQSEVCDKKNVIPISIAINSSTAKDDVLKETKFEEDLHRNNRTNVRLPQTMYPIFYELKLIPFLFDGNFTFNGDVLIRVNVTSLCKNITLHSIALKISEVSVWKLENSSISVNRLPIEISKQYVVESDQFYVIEFPNELEPNITYEINIKYKGILSDTLQGFYRSSYETENETR